MNSEDGAAHFMVIIPIVCNGLNLPHAEEGRVYGNIKPRLTW